jgi:ATP phosphoribosyltransferase regulatory subunit
MRKAFEKAGYPNVPFISANVWLMELNSGALLSPFGLLMAVAGLIYGDMIMIDLGLVNKIDYYTGIVFRGYVESQGEAVLSGGRYDSLFEEDGKFLPAVGFSANVDAINGVICKEPAVKVTDAVIFYADGFEKEDFDLFASLKAEKISAELSVFGTVSETADYCKKINAKSLYSVTENGVKEESF